MKKYTFILSILALAILLGGCSLTGGDNSSTKACLSESMDLSKDALVEALIVTKGDLSDSGQTEFPLADLVNYQYGYSAKGDSEPYYVTYELCNLQTGEYLSVGAAENVVDGGEVYSQLAIDSGNDPSSYSSGNYSDFTYENENGEVKLDIETPGDYAVNAFKGVEGGDWEWVASYEFVVTE